MARSLAVIAILIGSLVPRMGFAADTGLITKQSNHSVSETIQRFEEVGDPCHRCPLESARLGR